MITPEGMLDLAKKHVDDEVASDVSDDAAAAEICIHTIEDGPFCPADVAEDCTATLVEATRSGVTAELPAQRHQARYHVILHVYDLSYVSRIAGVPFFHFGVEVHGREYSFGEAGITSCRPGANPHHVHREACGLGFTRMTASQVLILKKFLKHSWRGYMYSPLGRNCQHFAASFCEALGVVGGRACIPERFCRLPAPTSTVAQASDTLFGMYASMPACSHLGPLSVRAWYSTVPDCGTAGKQVTSNAQAKCLSEV